MGSRWAARARLAILVPALFGCSADARPEVTIQREQRGDTSFIRITADSAATHSAQVDLVIGRVSGPEEYLFAEIADMHVDSEGRMLVFDHGLRSVRRFAPDGSYIGQVGSVGKGPGEFEMLWGLSTAADGRILLGDYFGQVHVFDSDAQYMDRWRAPRRALSVEPVVGNIDGTVTVTSFSPLPDGDYEYRLYFLDAAGEVQDSLTPHVPWRNEEESGHVHPTRHLAWSPTGFGVTSVSSRLGFEIFQRDQQAIVRVEQNVEGVPFANEERAEWADFVRFIRQRSRREPAFPLPPEFKPAFKHLQISRTGQIWLVRHQPALRNPGAADSIMGFPAPPDWIEPFRAEVYSDGGDYLASVAGPRDFSLMFVSNDTLWGAMRGEYGVPMPVRLVLNRPLPRP